jgi:hypothetical protein
MLHLILHNCNFRRATMDHPAQLTNGWPGLQPVTVDCPRRTLADSAVMW